MRSVEMEEGDMVGLVGLMGDAKTLTLGGERELATLKVLNISFLIKISKPGYIH